MKKIAFIAGLFFLLNTAAIFAQEQIITAKSKIMSVIVYNDRALVTRNAQLDLQPGIYEIQFSDLPGTIFEDSIRVSGKQLSSSQQNAEIKITGSLVERIFLEGTYEEKIKRIEDNILVLVDKDRDLQDSLNVLNAKREFLRSFQKYSENKIEKEVALQKIDMQVWQSALSFLTDGLTDANLKIHQIEKERKSLQDKLQALRKELNDSMISLPREKRNIKVNVIVLKPGKQDLNISYLIGDAGWLPLYDARVLMSDRSLEMTYYGQIRQKTGEDWNDVNIVLSTSRPAIGAKSPELLPWYITIFEPQLTSGNALFEVRKTKEVSASVPEAISDKTEAKSFSQVQQTITSALFEIKKKENIPSDGSSHKVIISIDTLKPDFDYISVPKLSENAYLKSTVLNKTGYPFIAGEVNVFQDADYIGRSSIGLIVKEETLTLDLGADPNINVKRELLYRNKEQGFFGNNEKISFGYKVTIENFKETSEWVTVVDQIPVSQDERVKIGVDKLSPEPQMKNINGLVRWKFNLGPKEKKEIFVAFTISYPSGIVVEGIQ